MTSFIVRPNGTITVKPLPHMRCRTTNLHTKNNALKEQQELVAYKDKVNIKVLYIETNVISKCKKMQDKWMPFNDIGNKNILTGTKFILNTNEVL